MSRFIDELRKCDPSYFVQAPTQETDPKRKYVGTPIGVLLDEWDRLVRERDQYKQQADFWLEKATGVTPQHWQAPEAS